MVHSHGRFVWHELMTTDPEAAKAFYADVMGWDTMDVSMPGSPYCLFTTAGAPVGGLMRLPDPIGAHATPHWMGYIGVDDVDAVVDRITPLGGAVRVPPTTVPNVSRFAVIADPQKATLALVKGLTPNQVPFPEPTASGRVGWHELFAADWEAAFVFYSQLFGWQKKQADVGPTGTYQHFSIGEETIGGMSTKPPTLPLPFWLYYFNTDDAGAAAKRVAARGGKNLYGPIEVPGGARIAHCADPQGALFGLLDRPSRKVVGYFVAPHESRDALGHPKA